MVRDAFRGRFRWFIMRCTAGTVLAALSLGLPASGASDTAHAMKPTYSGSIVVKISRFAPTDNRSGVYTSFRYTLTTTMAFSFAGSGRLLATRTTSAKLSGSYSTALTSTSNVCTSTAVGSGSLVGRIKFYVQPTVAAKTVSISVGDVSETTAPPWMSVCGLPQDKDGMIQRAILAASKSTPEVFVLPRGGGVLRKSGTVTPTIKGGSDSLTYHVTVVLKRVA